MRICQRPRGPTTLPRILEEIKEIIVAAMSTIDGDVVMKSQLQNFGKFYISHMILKLVLYTQ
jgi:hypothetical protein